MKVILLVSIFFTIYLAIFLSFNLRQDTMTIIQNRLKGLQISLIEQYYDRKGDIDWTHWTRELEQRRDDIRTEVKRGIRSGTGRRSEEDIDSLIDKSWDELLVAIGGRRKAAGIDEEKLQSILNRVLQALPSAAGALPAGAPAARPVSAVREDPLPGEPGEAEEIEELTGEAEEPAEVLEEAEAVDDVETVEEPADAEAADDVETVEELTDAEAADDVEAVEELTDAEEPPARKTEHSGGLLAAAEKVSTREPGVPLVFDSDDVPYIDVAGAMEEMGEHIDSVLSTMSLNEEEAELEELSGEDAEAADEPEEDGKAEDAGPPGLSQEDIALLASQIEFSPLDRDDEDRDQPLITDFEIVSPFATMLSNISISGETDQDGEAGEKESPSGEGEDAEFEMFVDPSDSDFPELSPVNPGAADDPVQEKKNSL
jgi:NACalpha-BTF3-like transcription factor